MGSEVKLRIRDRFVVQITPAFNCSEVENRLLTGGCRRKVLSILKTLHDNHLDLPGNPITSYILKTLVLYECEKHPREFEWDESAIGDRINGILLQLISCLHLTYSRANLQVPWRMLQNKFGDCSENYLQTQEHWKNCEMSTIK